MTVADPIVPDSERRGWVAALPAGLRPFVLLARIDRPIGAWLLYWPGAWGVALAGGAFARWDLLLWLGAGAVAMRGAGCVYNDIADRELDARVARTRDRPLASGRVTLHTAWTFLVGLCLVGLTVLLRLDRAAQVAALASLAPVAVYPFMKRLTGWPQAWLGIVFSWAAPVGWMAVAGAPAGPMWWLWAGAVSWVVGYDTIYALQDIEDDALAGIGSSARSLGRHARSGIAGFYAAAIALWARALWLVRPEPLALAALVPMALHLAWQVARLRPAEAADALVRFRSNRFAGLLMFLACAVIGLS